MHPQAFQGRVIGAPVARANIPCEALRAGLQFLKRPPPLLPAPLPAASTYSRGRWVGQWQACQDTQGRGGKSKNLSYRLLRTHQVPGSCVISHPHNSPVRSV